MQNKTWDDFFANLSAADDLQYTFDFANDNMATSTSVPKYSTTTTTIANIPGPTGGTYSPTVLPTLTIGNTPSSGFNWQPLLNNNSVFTIDDQAKSLDVKGDANFEGDVTIKGRSIIDTIEQISEKLAIFRPNEELEAKWEKLRELRNQYIELEREIIEKEKMWNILKK